MTLHVLLVHERVVLLRRAHPVRHPLLLLLLLLLLLGDAGHACGGSGHACPLRRRLLLLGLLLLLLLLGLLLGGSGGGCRGDVVRGRVAGRFARVDAVGVVGGGRFGGVEAGLDGVNKLAFV